MPICSPATISAKGKRDPFIDGIRGTLHIFLLLDHLAILLPVLFGFWSAFFEPLGFFSFAEAFVFLSGYVSGLVYTRIYRERGMAALLRKAFVRCGTVYSCYVLSVVILLCFAKCLGQDLNGWRSWDQLLTFPLPAAAGMVATLSCNPIFLEILPMYAMFLLFTPLIVLQLERKHHFAVIACSFLGWLVEQYAIGSGQGGLFYINGSIFTGYFSPLGWQTLFVIGLLCGHKTYDSNGPWLPRHPVCVFPVCCITIGLYMLRHSDAGMSIGQEWAAGSTMGPLRVLNFLSFAFAAASGRKLLQNAVSWRGFEFLSRHSLQVFAFHLMPICLLTSLISSKTPISIPVQCAAFLFCVAWLFLTAALAGLFGTGRHWVIEVWKNHCRCKDCTE
jgi:hypothetical protein